jgi:hypothetical protein
MSAYRYTGTLRILVRWVDHKSGTAGVIPPWGGRYRCTVRDAQSNRVLEQLWIGKPPADRTSVDSSESIDEAARCAASGYDGNLEGAEWGPDAIVVRRSQKGVGR